MILVKKFPMVLGEFPLDTAPSSVYCNPVLAVIGRRSAIFSVTKKLRREHGDTQDYLVEN